MSANTDATTDAKALRASASAVVGAILGYFAFKLQLNEGDNKFFTYALGLACSGFFIDSLKSLFSALKARNSPQEGSRSTGRTLGTALTITVVGICMFPLCSILAHYLDKLEDKGGVEIGIGLVAAFTAFVGPILLGSYHFYWVEHELSATGLNLVAAILVAGVFAAGSIVLWYYLNIEYGPKLYALLM